MLERGLHVGNKAPRVEHAADLDDRGEHRGVREIPAERALGDRTSVKGVYPALVAAQQRTNLVRGLMGIDDDRTLRVQAMRDVYRLEQRLVDDNDVIRIINVRMNGASLVRNAVVGGDRCAHALRTVLRKALHIFARRERRVREQQAGGLCALTAAAVPADLDHVLHAVSSCILLVLFAEKAKKRAFIPVKGRKLDHQPFV